MEGGSFVPMDATQAQIVTADWIPVGYFGNFFHGGMCFQNGLAPASVHGGGDQHPVDVTSLMARIGMAPVGFEIPDGALATTGYGAVGGVPTEAVMVQQQPTGSSDNRPPSALKASWTEEEDRILRDMVGHHGERKWSVIAQCLPGRIGKQCRERWINHLRPDIKQNDIWTEKEDKMLIDAHRYYGNRWSAIAKYLRGRSENAVKNHWNATLRSLKAKRRLKKKKSEQAPPGQFTNLEEYIRGVYMQGGMPAAPPTSPPHQPAYSDELSPAVHTAPAAVSAVPDNTAMSFNGNDNDDSAAGSSTKEMINLNLPPQEYYQLNLFPSVPEPEPEPEPELQLAPQDPRQSCSSQDMCQYAPYIKMLTSDLGSYYQADEGASSSNQGANCYYNGAWRDSAGGSGDPAGDRGDVAELAARQFFMLSNAQATLDSTRFK